MANWKSIVVVGSVILFTFLCRFATCVQCNILDKPIWRTYETLPDYQANTIPFDVLSMAKNAGNQVRINSIKPHLHHSDFITFEEKFIVRLDLTSLRIEVIDNGTFWAMSCMEILELQDNSLKTLPSDAFIGMNHLKVLNISKNSFTRLSPDMFRLMGALENLDLSMNLIRLIEANTFAHFPLLQYLNLSRNLLIDLDFAEWGLSSRSLITLNLTHNEIDVIKVNSNASYTHFSRLDVSDNEIEYIDVAAIKVMAPNMALFFIQNNNFHCVVLEKIIKDFQRFHMYHQSFNHTMQHVDGIDCKGNFDEDTTEFDRTHTFSKYPKVNPFLMTPVTVDTFIKTTTDNNSKILDAINSLRSLVWLLMALMLMFIVVTVLMAMGMLDGLLKKLRPQSDSLDTTMQSVENIRLLPNIGTSHV